ncbi:unnamed protein product, partial [Ascophyllum nodosum]
SRSRSSSCSSDGGPPEITLDDLSADTLAALRAHLAIKDATQVEETDTQGMKGTLVTEDFGLSQFWYDEGTQRAIAREVLMGARGGRAAVISAPSVMNGVKLLRSEGSVDLDTAAVHIFEYDRRFGQAYPDSFVYYDYNEPQRVPDGLRGSMDFVLMDPPYLSTECVEKFLETADALARHPRPAEADGEGHTHTSSPTTPMMFITSPLNHSFLKEKAGLRKTRFRLAFESKFATPMSLFTNYESEALGGWVEEDDE